MLLAQIGIEGTGPRKTFWLRSHLRRSWEGPFFSYKALLDAFLRSGEGYIWPERLEHLIERSPHDAPATEFIVVVNPFQRAPGKGFAKALGIRIPRATPEDIKEIKALLDALGVAPESIRSLRLQTRRKDMLAQMNTANTIQERIAINGVFRGQKLGRISTARVVHGVDFGGDFSDANFSHSRFFGTEEFDGPVLSSRFVGAKFTRCKFRNAHLSGDFAKANLSHTVFQSCELTGRFDGADLQDAILFDGNVGPGASFRGANLRCSNLWFPSLDQIRAARVGPKDIIGVCTGVIDIFGCRYGLVKPAQFVRGIRVVDDTRKVIPLKPTLSVRFLDLFMHVDFRSPDGVAMLLDIPKMNITCTDEASMSAGTLGVNAPGTTFLQLPESNGLELIGNYDQACFDECSFGRVHVSKGCFRNLNLTTTEINSMSLSMTGTDLHGVRLPRRVHSNVRFVECGPQDDRRAGVHLHAFSLPVELAQVVLDVWESAPFCEWLARQLCAKAWSKRSPQWLTSALQIIRSSHETTGLELADRLTENGVALARLLTQEEVAAFNLIARRNRINESQCVASP